MEIRNVEDCFEFRLLRKVKPDLEKSKKSLEMAKDRLTEAERALSFKMFNYVVLESYMAMFHSARALLYKDGIQEKSHYAVSIYLKEKYSDKIPLPIINLLEIHRTERHESMYGFDYRPEKEDAQLALDDAEAFVEEIKKLFKNKHT